MFQLIKFLIHQLPLAGGNKKLGIFLKCQAIGRLTFCFASCFPCFGFGFILQKYELRAAILRLLRSSQSICYITFLSRCELRRPILSNHKHKLRLDSVHFVTKFALKRLFETVSYLDELVLKTDIPICLGKWLSFEGRRLRGIVPSCQRFQRLYANLDALLKSLHLCIKSLVCCCRKLVLGELMSTLLNSFFKCAQLAFYQLFGSIAPG